MCTDTSGTNNTYFIVLCVFYLKNNEIIGIYQLNRKERDKTSCALISQTVHVVSMLAVTIMFVSMLFQSKLVSGAFSPSVGGASAH